MFLDFKNKLSSSKVTCQVCGGVLALLLQLYCPEGILISRPGAHGIIYSNLILQILNRLS